MNRSNLYWATNGGFLLLLVIGAALGSAASIHPVYLALLFAICSTPIFNATAFNDRYALLVIFSAVYFQFFGTVDLINLFRGVGSMDGVINQTEMVILMGGILTQLGYRLASRNAIDRSTTPPKDWPEHTLVVAGIFIWAIATWLTWQFKVNILTETNAAATARGLASINAWQTIGYLLATMVQPLGILIIAYAQCRYQRVYMLPLLIAVVLVQLTLGFVVDVKGDALIGAILIVVTRLLVRGTIPKGWLLTIAVFVAVAFPAMQANRMIRSQYRIDHAEAAQNLVDTIKLAFAKGEQVTEGNARAQTVFERMSLKGSVDMIVTRTGDEVPFQYGYTLTPMYAAFIPKIIWPNKPDVQTGQLVNKEFKVTNFSYTYISPSHLGELYWNFGWLGVLTGSLLVGLLLGHVGKRIDMTHGSSITKLMVAAVTVKSLILGFESTIAVTYVVWMRSMAAILFLHLLLARRNPSPENEPVQVVRHDALPVTDQTGSSFPNLLR